MGQRTSAFHLFDLIGGEGREQRSTEVHAAKGMAAAGVKAAIAPGAQQGWLSRIGSAVLPVSVSTAARGVTGAAGFATELGEQTRRIEKETQQTAPKPGPASVEAADAQKQAAASQKEAADKLSATADRFGSLIEQMASMNPTLGSPSVDT